MAATYHYRTGAVRIPTPIVNDGNATVAEGELYGHIHLVTGAYTLTLPSGKTGMNAIFIATTASTYHVKADAANLIRLLEVDLDVGDKISSTGKISDSVQIIWDSVNGKWIAAFMNCVFTDGGA